MGYKIAVHDVGYRIYINVLDEKFLHLNHYSRKCHSIARLDIARIRHKVFELRSILVDEKFRNQDWEKKMLEEATKQILKSGSRIDVSFDNKYFETCLPREELEKVLRDLNFVDAGRCQADLIFNKVDSPKVVEKKRQWSEDRRLYIPTIGTVIELTEDWEFRLYEERRNEQLMKLFGLELTEGYYYTSNKLSANVTLYKGCQLKVDRIYIRKGADEFDSITFFLHKATPDLIMIDALAGSEYALIEKTKNITKKPRFWAKLSDVNNIVCRVDLNSLSTN